jgi:hypothetical protein
MTHGTGVLALMLMPKGPTNDILEKADPKAILGIDGFAIARAFRSRLCRRSEDLRSTIGCYPVTPKTSG